MKKRFKVNYSAPKVAVLLLAVAAMAAYYNFSTLSAKADLEFNPGYFNVGWYHIVSGAEQLGAIYRTGAKTTFVQPAFYSDLQPYLEYSKSWGIKNGIGLNPEWFTAAGADVERIKTAIKQYKWSSSIASWALYDEPDVWRESRWATPAAMKQGYDAIKSVDSRRVFLSFSPAATKAEILEYAPAFDFFGIDYYPSLANNVEFGNKGAFNKYAEQVRKGVEVQNQLGKGFRMIIQSFGPNNKVFYRVPTYQEFRFMSLLPLASGAQGNIYYTYQHAKDYPTWVTTVAQPVLDELAVYKGLNKNIHLTTINSSCADCQGRIKYLVFADRANPKINYIVAVNEGPDTLRPTFDFAQPVTRVEVTREDGRNWVGLPLTSFSDDFGRYATHVYKVTRK